MIILKKWITRDFVKSHPNWIFVFGDNELRRGFGGQAKEMRGEPNSLGIRTKKYPSDKYYAFWTDDSYDENIKMINSDLELLKNYLNVSNKTIVIPADGIGSGKAKLAIYAPKTNKYLCEKIREICEGHEIKTIE